MNKKTVVILIVLGFLLTGVVGFFAGMEYKAYEIRSAISDVFEDWN